MGGAGGIDFAAALNNPALVNMATRMMTDPSIQNMLGQLSGMNNVDALLETGRQLAMQMSNDNPELFNQIRQQMMDQNGGAGEEGANNPQVIRTSNQNLKTTKLEPFPPLNSFLI